MASRKERDEEKVPKTQEAPEPEEKLEAKDGVIELEIGEPEEADDDDADEAEPQRAPRKERNRNRFREAQEKAARLEAELEQSRQANQQYQQQMQQYQHQRGHQDWQQQMQQEKETLFNDQKNLYAAYENETKNGTVALSAERQAYWDKQVQNFKDREYDLQFRIRGGGQQPSTEQIAQYVEQQRIARRYQDIVQNPAALRWALAVVEQRAAEGAVRGDPLYDDVAEEARRRFGMPSSNGHSAPRRPPPDQATRARYSGTSSRGSSGGSETVQVRMGANEQRLATKLYPNLSPEKAYRKWAEGPGKRAAVALKKSG